MKIDAMQLNIFGEPEVLNSGDSAAEKKPRKNPAENNKKARGQKPLTPVSSTGKELPPDRDRLVCYAGHQILITDRSLTLEQIRQQLERDFPELSVERVVWHWEKPEDMPGETGENHEARADAVPDGQDECIGQENESSKKPVIVVPVVTAGKKGLGEISRALYGYHWSVTEMMADPRPIHILAAKDGLYEVRKTPAGLFSRKLENVLGLDCWQEGLILNYPKIPVTALVTALMIFRAYCPYEVVVDICWERNKGQYCIVIPEQCVSEAGIMYRKPQAEIPLPDKVPVLELHSHGRERAFFSDVDDKDELATGLYGVMGLVDTNDPEIALRYSCGGVYKSVKPDQVFEGIIARKEA